jgi:hypothetical protein
MFSVIITPESISFFTAGRPWIVRKDHVNYDAVRKQVSHIQQGQQSGNNAVDRWIKDLLDLVDIKTFTAKYVVERVQISDDEVRFDGKKVDGVIAKRILAFDKEGLDIRPLAMFLNRVSQNPDISARDDIFLFLESGLLPITADGCFLAYKYVRNDYYSVHTGRGPGEVRNMVGDSPSLPRDECDKNRHNTCSRGLHFCSYQYLGAGAGSDARIVVVKVAPEDVTSIPIDYNHSKGRAWRYTVVAEVEHTPALETRYADKPVVASEGAYDDGEGDDTSFAAACDTPTDATDWHNATLQEAADVTDEEDPYFDPEDGVPKEVVTTDVTFKITKRRKITGTELKQMVADFGQRGTSKKLGVPRTTIQDWLKRASA